MRDTPNIGDLTHKASLDETEFEEEEKDLNNCLELTNFINELQKCTDKTARELPQMRRCALMRLLEVLVAYHYDRIIRAVRLPPRPQTTFLDDVPIENVAPAP